MLKFTDGSGTTIATLDDTDSEPTLIEDKSKKKNSKKKKIKGEMGYFERPLPQTIGQIVPVISTTNKDKK